MFEKLNVVNPFKKKKMIPAEKDFIRNNRNFWSDFPTKNNSNYKILVEQPSIPTATHSLATITIVLNQAKSFTPVWLHSSDWNIELLKSYVSTAEYIKHPKSIVNILKIILSSIYKYINMFKTKDILSFSYDGVKYGDIVYDTYLAHEKVATIKRIDIKLLFVIFVCIYKHENFRKMLDSDAFKAVLVSHQVTIDSGVLLRTALRYGYKGYINTGTHRTTLQCFDELSDVYNYQHKPFPEDIDAIITKLGSKFDLAYNSVYNEHISGNCSKDATYAFSKDTTYYTDRKLFNRNYKLDSTKKNVFVMLHAFTDYPHSHFKWMIFNDYYDWFIETLNFAKKHDNVNWIFKQHPSIKYYPAKDVSFDALFSDIPDNVIYISENDQIDTRSLTYCADIVVTCLGSAGFEMPAMAGIPSITASDNFYTNLGFAIEPKTKIEYFETLSNAHNIERLTPEQQKRAQAAFMFIHKFSIVNNSACPPIISHDDHIDSMIISKHMGKIYELYEKNGQMIKNELNDYTKEVSEINFRRLNSLDHFLENY